MKYKLVKTPDYDEWLDSESLKSQVQIEKRISKIETDGYFGTIKDLEDNVWELKWKNGRRVYYAYVPVSKILLLLGWNKNGQNYDITQAKKIYKEYTDEA